MNMVQFNKVIERQWKSYRAQCKRFGREFNPKHVWSVPWKPRKQIFEQRNLDFDPFTGLGHSYRWYEVTKRFGRTQVLNSYRYSSTTSTHVYALRGLLEELGIKYVCIEAPRGLQDLPAAMRYHTWELAAAIVRDKYARKGPTQHWAGGDWQSSVQYHRKAIAWLSRHTPKLPLAEFIQDAEAERAKRLERERIKRAVLKQQLAAMPAPMPVALADNVIPLKAVRA